jgi:hydroxymethylpyrimidine pyrophosphatase-like HAD family hydrolase
VLIENPNQIDIITQILPKELYLNLIRDNLAMIMHRKATKYEAVLEIADEFIVSKSEIIAFG